MSALWFKLWLERKIVRDLSTDEIIPDQFRSAHDLIAEKDSKPLIKRLNLLRSQVMQIFQDKR